LRDEKSILVKLVYFRLYAAFVLSSVCHEWSGAPASACNVGHAAAFAVNAAVVRSQWQPRVWTFPLHPPINADYDAGQAQVPFF